MSRVLERLEKIRDIMTEEGAPGGYFSKLHDKRGHAIVVAMDTAEDAAEAARTYEQVPFESDDFGENYLRLYGFLQAVFNQQDSIKLLHCNVMGSQLQIPATSPWTEIRVLRNRVAGHPTDHRNKERIFLTRVSLRQWCFQYEIYDERKDKRQFVDADLKRLYDGYTEKATNALDEILTRLIEMRGNSEHSEHRAG